MSRSDDLPADRSQLKADLVAYLDGELDAETSRELENLLATDPDARDEMQRMEQAWEMLDQLPRAEVDEAFRHSTIEMVAVSAAEEIALLENELPRQRRRRLLAGLMALVASLGVGFFSVYTFWPNPNEQLLRDLPLLERLDQYRQVDNAEFLRQLAKQELLPVVASATLSEPTSLAERQLQIEQLSPTDKESLLRKQQRFTELPPHEQQRIRTLHTEIQQDPQAPTLRGVLTSYYDWLVQQSPPQRAGLASLDTVARIERIDKLRKEEQQRELNHLSPADLDAVAGWLEEQVQSRLTKSDPPMPVQDLPPATRRGVLMLVASSRFQVLMGSSHLTPAAIASLRAALSPAGQAKLDQLDTEDKRRKVLVGWGDGWFPQAIRNSIKKYHDGLMADVRKEDLVKFFEELPAEDRVELERASSPESREMRLRVMYLRKYKSEQIPEFARDIKMEPWWWMRGGPRGDGRGGDGRGGDNRGPGLGPGRDRDPNREGGPPPGAPRRGPGPNPGQAPLPPGESL